MVHEAGICKDANGLFTICRISWHQHGWMVPAYTLPAKLQDYVVMRVVVRQGFSRDMADMLLGDIKNAIAELEKLEYPTSTRIAQEKNLPVEAKVFNHTGKPQAAKK